MSHLPSNTFEGPVCVDCQTTWPCRALVIPRSNWELITEARRQVDHWSKIRIAHARGPMSLTMLESRRLLLNYEDLANALVRAQMSRDCLFVLTVGLTSVIAGYCAVYYASTIERGAS